MAGKIGGVRAPGSFAVFSLCFAITGSVSVWLGPDASWDFRNYHLYNAYAALTGTLWTDIAPAQLQSFYHPVLDVVQYVLRRALNAHPVLLAFILAAPQAVAAWLAYRLARRVVAPAAAVVATLLGVTGAAGLSTVGSTMSDMIPGCLVVAALGLLCRPAIALPLQMPAAVAAGLFAGSAVALKLTAAPYAIGLLAAVLVSSPRKAPIFAASAATALLALAGPWWWVLWQHTGNPVFPYFNQIFRSDWAPLSAMTDTRFLPRDFGGTLLFPAFWAFRPSMAASELPVRDPRLLLGLVAWCAILAGARRSRTRMPVPALAAFWLVAYIVWEGTFGVFRYAVVLELLSGIPILLATVSLGRWGLPAGAALGAGVCAITIYPGWGHAPPGRLALDVAPPPFARDSLVLLLDPAPMAYVAAFAPPGVRFVGANSNLVRPDGVTVPEAAVRAALKTEAGTLWGLEAPEDQPGAADRALTAYGLARDAPCVRVRSNLDHDAILACRLRRLSDPGPGRAEPYAQARPAPD